jgi:hypothetical protein
MLQAVAPYCFTCSSWNTVDISLLHFRTDSPTLKRACLLLFIICQGLSCFAQTTDEVRPLEPGRLVEREIE